MRVQPFVKLRRAAGLAAVLFAGASFASAAPVPTITTLTMASNGTALSSGSKLGSGKILTLVAAVSAGGSAVTTGQVSLCDATAISCTDIHLFGTAQLTSAGMARFRFVPGIGSHSYKAVFAGTPNGVVGYAGSVSGVSMLSVTGLHATTTTMTVDGQQGHYNLTATLAGINDFPKIPAPTGTLSFIDTTSSNAVLATPAMSEATAGFSLLNVSKPATDEANFVAVADFNEDGYADLAIGDDNSGSVKLSILLGKGDGTFTRAPSPTVGLYVDSIAVADFNGDGAPDLAVSSVDDNTLTILLGNGDGTFTPAPTLDTISTPQSVVTCDFNRDGTADLAVVNANAVLIFLGNGDGTFRQAPASPSLGSAMLGLAAGDFNEDGNPDLAVANSQESGTIVILLGKGDGTFAVAPVSASTGPSPDELVVGDFNGDGKLDLAVSDYDGELQQSAVTVLLGNGDGTFKATSYPASGLNFRGVAIGDFNGDGVADLAEGQFWQALVIVFTGNGDGTFQSGVNLPNQAFLASGYLAAADFNGDGIADLASPDGNAGGTVSILLGQPVQTATAMLADYSVPGNGTHQIKASYSGDSLYKASQSATTPLVALVNPVMTVNASVSSITTGQGLSLSVTVTGGAGNPVPIGYVFVENTDFPPDGAQLTNGSATIAVPVGALKAGTDTLTVEYQPGGASYTIYNSQMATVPIVVTAAPVTATPVISPPGGAYTTNQNVTITDATPGATIYFTTDGTDPATWSTVYTGPIVLPLGIVVKAMALANGDGPSAITTATYTLATNNAVPLVSGMSPAFAAANSPAFTLTISGVGFVSTSTVYWGKTALTTQFVSTTQLTAAIPASNLTTSGIAAVMVQTPSPGGGTSNVFQFQIDSAGATNPPVFAAASATIMAGSTASYQVTLPSTITNVSANCLNLPAGATCSYSATNNAVTIQTLPATPSGIYHVTVVFTETEPAVASALAVLPILLLPCLLLREKAPTKSGQHRILTTMILLTAAVFLSACGSNSASTTPPPSNPTQQVISSGVVTLTVQ